MTSINRISNIIHDAGLGNDLSKMDGATVNKIKQGLAGDVSAADIRSLANYHTGNVAGFLSDLKALEEGKTPPNLEKARETAASAELLASLKTLFEGIRDPDALAALLIEFASMSRQNALDSRLAARAQARAELEGQASETREAGQKLMMGALVSMVFTLVASAVTVMAAAKNLGELGKARTETMKGLQAENLAQKHAGAAQAAPGTQQTQLQQAHGRMAEAFGSDAKRFSGNAEMIMKRVDISGQFATAIAGVLNSLGQLGQSGMQAESKNSEADGQEMAAAAQDSQAAADMAKQFQDELQEMISSAMKFLREMAQAETDMMASASRL